LASSAGRRYHLLMVKVFDWKGGRALPEELRKLLPEELSDLPPGRYVVESADHVPELTPEEEEGLRQAITSARAGRVVDADEVRRRIETKLGR